MAYPVYPDGGSSVSPTPATVPLDPAELQELEALLEQYGPEILGAGALGASLIPGPTGVAVGAPQALAQLGAGLGQDVPPEILRSSFAGQVAQPGELAGGAAKFPGALARMIMDWSAPKGSLAATQLTPQDISELAGTPMTKGEETALGNVIGGGLGALVAPLGMAGVGRYLSGLTDFDDVASAGLEGLSRAAAEYAPSPSKQAAVRGAYDEAVLPVEPSASAQGSVRSAYDKTMVPADQPKWVRGIIKKDYKGKPSKPARASDRLDPVPDEEWYARQYPEQQAGASFWEKGQKHVATTKNGDVFLVPEGEHSGFIKLQMVKDGKIVGEMGGTDFRPYLREGLDPPSWNVSDIAVAKDYRRQGVGTDLVMAAEEMSGLPVSISGPFTADSASFIRKNPRLFRQTLRDRGLKGDRLEAAWQDWLKRNPGSQESPLPSEEWVGALGPDVLNPRRATSHTAPASAQGSVRGAYDEAMTPEAPKTQPPTKTPEFKRWFGKSKIVDEGGEPVDVYHGTSHDFDAFSPSTIRNKWGSASYFSDNPVDVAKNYARAEGPDLKNRIGMEADYIDLYELDEDEILDAAERILRENPDPEIMDLFIKGDVDGLTQQIEPDLVEEIARHRVMGDGFRTLKGNIKMENPVYLDPSGKKGTTEFEIEAVWDESGEDIIDEVGSGVELLEAIDTVGRRWDADYAVRDIQQEILGEMSDGSITAVELDEVINANMSSIMDPETGEIASGEFIKEVFQELGFDGIVADAHHYFGPRNIGGFRTPGMEHVTPGTYHYMTFEPTQFKSHLNIGTYDPKDPRFNRGIIGAAGAEAVRPEEQELME